MSSESRRPNYHQTDAAYETGDKQKVNDHFKKIKLPLDVNFTNVIVLGKPSPIPFAFLKHLVQLLREKHEIKDVFIQCNKEGNSTTWDVKSQAFTLVPDGDTKPEIWRKINTSSVVIAPSLPILDLSHAFDSSGPALLICRDIPGIVATHVGPNEVLRKGDWRLFFASMVLGGCKMEMPLLEGGKSWCRETSIHRFKFSIETPIAIQGWIPMWIGKPRTWVCS